MFTKHRDFDQMDYSTYWMSGCLRNIGILIKRTIPHIGRVDVYVTYWSNRQFYILDEWMFTKHRDFDQTDNSTYWMSGCSQNIGILIERTIPHIGWVDFYKTSMSRGLWNIRILNRHTTVKIRRLEAYETWGFRTDG